MESRDVILAFDSGTTGCRAFLINSNGEVVGKEYQEFEQIYPHAGWVEHDPQVIWRVQMEVAKRVIANTGTDNKDIKGIGISNQRETVVVWDKYTGEPVANAIVWQDRRTAEYCEQLIQEGHESYVKKNTGLRIDPYFSGTKIKWILDHISGARERAERGELLFGTVDSWLIWNLTGGKLHITDYSNASRTMLFNIRTLSWDKHLLEVLGIPENMLPEVQPSSQVYGKTIHGLFGECEIPIAGAIGDQQAALFGQMCFEPGTVKATYGTGATLMMNTGKKVVLSENGLLTSVGWGLDGEVEYALEGIYYVAGATIQWLRDGLNLIHESAESEACAYKVSDNNGVYIVPAFVGLSAPYWDSHARGTITGLTRGTDKNHLVRAGLESIAYQMKDLVLCMEDDSGIKATELKVDGGVTNNNFVMEFQASLLGIPVVRPQNVDASVRGAAFMAGMAVGMWNSKEEIKKLYLVDKKFEPECNEEEMKQYYSGWQDAVKRTLSDRER